MNIYDVLRKVVGGEQFTDFERATAVELVRQLEQLNVFGTTARFLDPATHECRAGEYWPATSRCDLCSVPMPVRPHSCVPITTWGRWGPGANQCKICGREMM